VVVPDGEVASAGGNDSFLAGRPRTALRASSNCCSGNDSNCDSLIGGIPGRTSSGRPAPNGEGPICLGCIAEALLVPESASRRISSLGSPSDGASDGEALSDFDVSVRSGAGGGSKASRRLDGPDSLAGSVAGGAASIGWLEVGVGSGKPRRKADRAAGCSPIGLGDTGTGRPTVLGGLDRASGEPSEGASPE
jgi:hypothetical protein